jgi:hypothetical protein
MEILHSRVQAAFLRRQEGACFPQQQHPREYGGVVGWWVVVGDY